jgi:hypothetical protein
MQSLGSTSQRLQSLGFANDDTNQGMCLYLRIVTCEPSDKMSNMS